MARNVLEIVLQAIDKASGPLGKVSKATDDLGKSSKKSGTDMKALGATALKVTGTIAAFGFAAKKAFDLGKEGAAIKQTGQSFEFLLKKVGASADLLGELRAASKGTISDMDLMSSTATLLAGAQGALATQLASSTPRLLEIAKAAQKLNPALGDTTFLYNSLATGVKRASPMILDNLGLTIRLGAANSAYAKALGKTVEALTADEQKQALLNETLRAGAVLIAQAGGTTDSATDAYAELSATTENLTNILKILVHDGLEPLVQTMADQAGVILSNVTALSELDRAVAAGIITEKEARFTAFALKTERIEGAEVLETLKQKTDAVASADRAMIGALQMHTSATADAADKTYDLSAALLEESGYADKALLAHDRLNSAIVTTGTVSRDAAYDVGILAEAVVLLGGDFTTLTGVAAEWLGWATRNKDLQQDSNKVTRDATKMERLYTEAKEAGLEEDEIRFAMGSDLQALSEDGIAQAGRQADAQEMQTEWSIRQANAQEFLANLTGDSSDAAARNTQVLAANTAMQNSLDLAIGDTTQEILDQEFKVDALAQAYRAMPTARNLALWTAEATVLDGLQGAHRRLQSELNATSRAERNLAASVRDRLAAQGESVAPGQGIVTPGGGLRAPRTPAEHEEVHGEAFSGAGGREGWEHIRDLAKDMKARHAGADQGGKMADWGGAFLRTQVQAGGYGNYDEATIQAGLEAAGFSGIVGGAHGLSGVVPGGFPNDSFLIGATSGEHVQVTPRGQGGGMVINNVNVYGVQTDSQLFDAVTKVARQRGRAFAKVM